MNTENYEKNLKHIHNRMIELEDEFDTLAFDYGNDNPQGCIELLKELETDYYIRRTR
jgi:hypothetical protein